MQANPTLSICLALIGGLTPGCYQSTVAPPTPEISMSTDSVLEVELPKPESNVVVASQQGFSSETVGGRVRVTFQLVEFQDSPVVDAALNGLWKDTAPDAQELSGSGGPQCRIMANDEISKMMAGLQNQGLAKCYRLWQKDVLGGQCETWGTGSVPAGLEIEATATVHANQRVKVWFNSNPMAAMGADQKLVIAGPTTSGTVTEITRVPFLGDIPAIGPMFFSKQTHRKEVHKALYVVTAETISE